MTNFRKNLVNILWGTSLSLVIGGVGYYHHFSEKIDYKNSHFKEDFPTHARISELNEKVNRNRDKVRRVKDGMETADAFSHHLIHTEYTANFGEYTPGCDSLCYPPARKQYFRILGDPFNYSFPFQYLEALTAVTIYRIQTPDDIKNLEDDILKLTEISDRDEAEVDSLNRSYDHEEEIGRILDCTKETERGRNASVLGFSLFGIFSSLKIAKSYRALRVNRKGGLK